MAYTRPEAAEAVAGAGTPAGPSAVGVEAADGDEQCSKQHQSGHRKRL